MRQVSFSRLASSASSRSSSPAGPVPAAATASMLAELVGGRALQRDDVVRLQRRDFGVERFDGLDQRVTPGHRSSSNRTSSAIIRSAIVAGRIGKSPRSIARLTSATRSTSTGGEAASDLATPDSAAVSRQAAAGSPARSRTARASDTRCTFVSLIAGLGLIESTMSAPFGFRDRGRNDRCRAGL